jgi:hypothetical protein
VLAVCPLGAAGIRPEVNAGEPPTVASNAHEDRTAVRVSGIVVDANGKPVPKAIVICQRDEKYGGDVETISDERGKFEFNVTKPIGRLEMLHTWAYAEGHAFRTVMLRTIGFAEAIIRDPVIKLPPAERISLIVNTPKIEPAIGAIVAPRVVQVPNGVYAADESTGLGSWMPDRLAEVLAQPVGDDGSVSFASIPLKLLDSLRVESAEFGIQDFEHFEDELRLAPVGRIEGRIDASDTAMLAGIDVYLETETRDLYVPKLSRNGFAKTRVDENGRFIVPAMAEGKLRLQFNWPNQSPVRPVLDEKEPVVANGTTSEILIREVPAVAVRGRLVAGEERRPVSGAVISAGNTGLGFGHSAPVESDANGEFEVKTIAGEVRISVIVHGKIVDDERRYDLPPTRPVNIPEGVDEFEIDEIVMKLQKVVSGTLLTAEGTPSVDVDVALKAVSFKHLAGKSRTDNYGKFDMPVSDYYDRSLYEEQLSRSRGRFPNQWVKLSPATSPMETPKRTDLKIVSEAPLVLQEP